MYDNHFRELAVADTGSSWIKINPTLMASTILSLVKDALDQVCSRCLKVDFSHRKCALASFLQSGIHPRYHPYHLASPFLPPIPSAEQGLLGFTWYTCLAAPSKSKHVCSS